MKKIRLGVLLALLATGFVVGAAHAEGGGNDCTGKKANASYCDLDGDGIANKDDADVDGDGVADDSDVCPRDPADGCETGGGEPGGELPDPTTLVPPVDPGTVPDPTTLVDPSTLPDPTTLVPPVDPGTVPDPTTLVDPSTLPDPTTLVPPVG